MACAASLHPLSSSSRGLFPTLCRRSTFPAIFHRLRGFSSTSPLVSTVNRLIPVRAQARRGFSVKEDEVASEYQNDVQPCSSSTTCLDLGSPRRPSQPLIRTSGWSQDHPGPLIDPPLAADMEFQTPLRIVEYPDPILRVNLVDEMFDVMHKTDGIGLSAPQVGINVQLMVFTPVVECGKGEEIPRKRDPLTRRPETVKIDAQDIKGARFTVSLSGLPA